MRLSSKPCIILIGVSGSLTAYGLGLKGTDYLAVDQDWNTAILATVEAGVSTGNIKPGANLGIEIQITNAKSFDSFTVIEPDVGLESTPDISGKNPDGTSWSGYAISISMEKGKDGEIEGNVEPFKIEPHASIKSTAEVDVDPAITLASDVIKYMLNKLLIMAVSSTNDIKNAVNNVIGENVLAY